MDPYEVGWSELKRMRLVPEGKREDINEVTSTWIVGACTWVFLGLIAGLLLIIYLGGPVPH